MCVVNNPRPKPWRDPVQLFQEPFAPDPAFMRHLVAMLDRCPALAYACTFGRPCSPTDARCEA